MKWNKREAIKCLQELRSPFEEIKPQGKGMLGGMAEKIKQMIGKQPPQTRVIK